MTYESPDINVGAPRARDTIDDLLRAAKEEGHATVEIKVWQTDTVVVPDGEVGVAATDELNGCHVSFIVTPVEGGDALTITHFPPGIGEGRYRQTLVDLKASIQAGGRMPSAVITLAASDRPAAEDSLAGAIFEGVPLHTLSYVARDKERRKGPDAGRCMAVLDNRGTSTLHIFTDSGDQVVTL